MITTQPTKSAQPKLHAYIAQHSRYSRRKAEELIREGRVRVNGLPATIGQRVSPESDQVTIDDRALTTSQHTWTILINKPTGYVSTTSDELGRRTVIDFLRHHWREGAFPERLYPVGRLDQDSDGLMILTNDGVLTQQMTHPTFEVPKTYSVVVEGAPTERAVAHLEKGVKLKEGYTAPATVELIKLGTESTLLITIHEGRKHQVKRMCERVGYPVLKLTRVQFGTHRLEDLAGKPYKVLTKS